jgi:hypothetical protein
MTQHSTPRGARLIGLALLIFSAAWCLADSSYTYQVLARVDGTTITGISGAPSLNDNGVVAFAGTVPGGHAIFANTGPFGVVQNIAPNFKAFNFDFHLRINNKEQISDDDAEVGYYAVRVWDASSPNSYNFVDEINGVNGSFAIATINNDSQVAYLSIGGIGSSDALISKGPAGKFQATLTGIARPMIADNGSIVAKIGGSTASGPIRVFNGSLTSYVDVALAGNGSFTSLDSWPCISQDGQVVAFYGTDANGPGIFIVTNTSTGFLGSIPYKIAGKAQGFSSFQTFSRVSVKTSPQQASSGTVVYIGTQSNVTGIYMSQFQMPAGSPTVVSAPIPVIVQGQTLPTNLNLTGTVQSLAIEDPLNVNGSVAFLVQTSGGDAAVVRADPQTAIVDLAITSLSWNQAEGGVDFQYEVDNGPLTTATTATLNWASGTTVVSGAPTIFTQPIPAGANGQSGVIHIPGSAFGTIPQGATTLLLALDPSNLISEANKNNNTLTLGPSTHAPLQTADQPDPGNSESQLTPALQVAVQQFRQNVANQPGTHSFKVTSTYRPYDYQAHLYEIRTNYIELLQDFGMQGIIVAGGQYGRPQLRTTPGTVSMLSQTIVDAINQQIVEHLLIPGVPNHAPRVNPPSASKHTLLPAQAVDISIAGLSDGQKLALAQTAGLWRPHPNDLVHFELSGSTPGNNTLQATILGNSPINLLVVDPSGKKIGFDSTANAVVNDFGGFANYSGTNTEPQVILLPADQVQQGSYFIGGVGTGQGSYTIELQLVGEDATTLLADDILAAGSASTAQPIATIPAVDLFLHTVRLAIEPIQIGTLIYWPAWVSNVVLQGTPSFGAPVWTPLSNTDYILNQLQVTNPQTQQFFRLSR